MIILVLAAWFTVAARLATIPRAFHSIESEQFTLRDKNGKRRALLFVAQEGFPTLSFFDPSFGSLKIIPVLSDERQVVA